MIRPGDETEQLFLSITKNCETLIKQNHTKTEYYNLNMRDLTKRLILNMLTLAWKRNWL